MSDDNGQGSGNQTGTTTGTDADTKTDTTTDAGTGTTDATGTDSTTTDTSTDTADKDEKVSKAEFDKVFARMQAADRAKNAAEEALRKKNEAEMTEAERTKAQLADATKKAEDLAKKHTAILIENAFHRENKLAWHDVADAIAALDMSGVEITEDGKVTGMADAIKDVAKRKPHFVKAEGTQKPAANGQAGNGQRKGEDGVTPDRAAMVKRFPALGK